MISYLLAMRFNKLLVIPPNKVTSTFLLLRFKSNLIERLIGVSKGLTLSISNLLSNLVMYLNWLRNIPFSHYLVCKPRKN